jgi:hypothetical protein
MDRRQFLSAAAAGGAAAALLPSSASSQTRSAVAALPDRSTGWATIKHQFDIDPADPWSSGGSPREW